jgi:GGDEF domain-containing protein
MVATPVLEQARDALLDLVRWPDFDRSFGVAAFRYAASLGEPIDTQGLIAYWEGRAVGGLQTARRYRWGLTFRAEAHDPRYAKSPPGFVFWQPRAREQLEYDPTAFGRRMAVPAVVSESLAFLHDCAGGGDRDVANRAKTLLTEALPVAEFDAARFVRAIDPWGDTFGLWCLSRREAVLADLRALASAIALRYAAMAIRTAGIVEGSRFPFHGQPLVSGSAHLATALRTLGESPGVLGSLLAFVAGARSPGGGWHDPEQPDDVLTTLAAAELLSSLDPFFDPAPTVAFYTRTQERGGWWRALGPEVPWLTAGIAEWLAALELPFAARFRWPYAADTARDRKTGLPTFAYFDDLARLLGATPGLGAVPIDLAFVDLAAFGDFNNREGQALGDEALRVFATALAAVPDAIAVRDGGDEFLLVGAPTATSLHAGIDAFAAGWPAHFAGVFPNVPPLAVRVVQTSGRCDALMEARERLGRAIGRRKSVRPETGVVARWTV